MERKILVIGDDYSRLQDAINVYKSATGLEVEVASLEKVISSFHSSEKISVADIIYNAVEQLAKIETAQHARPQSKLNRKGGLKNKKNWRH